MVQTAQSFHSNIMYRLLLSILLLLLIAFPACEDRSDTSNPIAGDDDGGEQDGTEDGENSQTPSLPLALCGMNPYTLLERDKVGDLVDWEEMTFYNLTPSTVDALLTAGGYAQLTPSAFGSRVFRYRYTTQDKGRQVEATALLSVPAHVDMPEDGLPYYFFLHGTAGFSDPCAPSRSDSTALIGVILATNGFIGILPDYIGMNGFGAPSEVAHAYTVGEQAAIGSWDALRAAEILIAEELADTITPNGKTVIFGGSQGGHSAFFTERYGPYYAPEYDVKAVIAVAPPIDVRTLMVDALSTYSDSTYSFLAALTAMRLWYGEPASLESVFTNEEPYYFSNTAEENIYPVEECNPGDAVKEASITSVFNDSFRQAVLDERWEDIEPWTCYLKESEIYNSSVPALRYTPTLVVFGENDELVITDKQQEHFEALCQDGHMLEYLECSGAPHIDVTVWSLFEQFAWARDRLADKELDQSVQCRILDPICCSGTPEDVCE